MMDRSVRSDTCKPACAANNGVEVSTPKTTHPANAVYPVRTAKSEIEFKGPLYGKSLAIVDHHALLRDCLTRVLASENGMLTRCFGSAQDLVAACTPHQFDVVILGCTGHAHQSIMSLLTTLSQGCQPRGLMVMLDKCDHATVCDTLRFGVRGIMPANIPVNLVTDAIAIVLAGGTYLPEESFISQSSQMAPSCTRGLTTRERQVLELLKAGQPNKQIARSLGLCEGTVKVHLHNIMQKLGTSNRTQTIVALGA